MKIMKWTHFLNTVDIEQEGIDEGPALKRDSMILFYYLIYSKYVEQ